MHRHDPLPPKKTGSPRSTDIPRRSSGFGIKKLIGAGGLLTLFLMALYLFGLFVMVISLNFRDPNSSAFMRATLIDLQKETPQASLQHQWVPYADISDNLKRAVVASEDANFFSHSGVEWDAIRQAWHYNREQAGQGKARRRGGSTITQQLAKNLFLSSRRSYLRKTQELLLTYMLEAVLSKQRILELYLNLAQWGRHTFGAQAAAQRYFKVPAGKLTASQAARLAVMLPNPATYERQLNSAYLNSRTATIVQRQRLIRLP